LKLFGIEYDPLIVFVRVGDIDDPDYVLMIFLDGFASFSGNFAFPKLMVICCHIFQVNAQHSSTSTSYLKFAQPIIFLEIDLDILSQIQLQFLPFLIYKGIIIQN